jgi:hypothetical protein
VRNHLRGQRWSEAIPDGYQLALLGVPIFAIAGGGDLIWHTLFGFEVGIEPLLSPTHLLLAFSAILIMSGPLRAAMRRDTPVESQNWATLLPAILSMTAVLSVFTFFTSFVNPFVQTWTLQATFDDGKELGIASVLLLAGILMGFVLVVLRRWKLPIGTLTLVFTLNVALMGVFNDNYPLIPVATLAGLIADFLIWWLQPSTDHPHHWHHMEDPPVVRLVCNGRAYRAGAELPDGAAEERGNTRRIVGAVVLHLTNT